MVLLKNIIVISSSCLWCKRLLYSLRKKNSQMSKGKQIRLYFSPSKRHSLQKLRNEKHKVKVHAARTINKNARLKSHLTSIKCQMEEVSNKSLTKLIENSEIPKPQSILLHEIFAVAKYKNSKSRHYSDSWIILCILFQIRLDKMSK